jgi:hypothetical protein
LNSHLLRHFSSVQGEGDIQALLDVKVQFLTHRGLEIRCTRGQLIIANLDGSEYKNTTFIGQAIQGEACVDGGERDLCPGNRRTGIILNHPGNSALISLGPR